MESEYTKSRERARLAVREEEAFRTPKLYFPDDDSWKEELNGVIAGIVERLQKNDEAKQKGDTEEVPGSLVSEVRSAPEDDRTTMSETDHLMALISDQNRLIFEQNKILFSMSKSIEKLVAEARRRK